MKCLHTYLEHKAMQMKKISCHEIDKKTLQMKIECSHPVVKSIFIWLYMIREILDFFTS